MQRRIGQRVFCLAEGRIGLQVFRVDRDLEVPSGFRITLRDESAHRVTIRMSDGYANVDWSGFRNSPGDLEPGAGAQNDRLIAIS